jgi:SAM-dependent methyltransferase
MTPGLLALELGRAYLDAQGLSDGFVDTIHPSDEMYLTIAAYDHVPPERYCIEYHRAGIEALAVLQNVLAHAGRRLPDLDGLLEFACGYGRFTRHLVREFDPARVWSSDIQPGTVEFVSGTFGVNGFPSVTDPAALSFPRRFPLIWVGSLFSHLPRPRFEAWMRRLREALTDDGLLVFSTHGAKVLPQMEKHPSGFTFVRKSESLSLDVDEYGTTFVTPEVLTGIAAGCGLPHLYGVERDLWWIQDVWVAAKHAVPGLASLRRAPVVRGSIDHVKIDETGQAWIGGWTLVAKHDAPVTRVDVRLDGHSIALAELIPDTEASSDAAQLPDCVHAAWRLHGDASVLGAGRHVLTAVATASSGLPTCIDARALDHVPGQSLQWSEG